jgi:AraC family ethanolamine operon transcriptional activator
LIFDSFDEYIVAIQHAQVRITLAGPEQRNWTLSHMAMNDMSVQWGSDGAANVIEGTSQPGGLTLFVPLQNSDAIIGNGERMDDTTVMLLRPGTEFCLAATGTNRWSSVFVPNNLLPASQGDPAPARHDEHGALPPSKAGRKLQGLLTSLGATFHQTPDAFCSELAIQVTKQRLTESVLNALQPQRDENVPSGRPAIPREQVIQGVLRVMEENANERVSIFQLSNMAGVSERTLRTVFRQYFGVAPARYLKLRTLHQARQALKTADLSATSVTEIAVRLGIWEFGRFSSDYRMLFGESPSETFRK